LTTDIFEFRGKYLAQHSIVDRKSDNIGEDLHANYISRRQVKVVANLYIL
jgi:hypothetical protein